MTRPALVAAPSIRVNGVDGPAPTPPAAQASRTPADQPSNGVDGRGRTHGGRRHVASTIALAVPLVLVNAAAVFGQSAWAYEHFAVFPGIDQVPAGRLVVAILFAAAIEAIGVYLAFEAHAALMAGDASLRLRLGSYGVGGLVGALNFWHFADGWQPNTLAVTFGALSSISPWLWSIRSRSLNRDRLRTLGLVDPRAVRFSPLRWVLYPGRTFRAFRAAVWAGEVSPTAAVALVEPVEEPVDDVLMRIALIEAGRLLGAGQRVNRDNLAAAIRGRGQTISSARAGQLVKELGDLVATPEPQDASA